MMTAVVYGLFVVLLFMIVFKTSKEVIQPKEKPDRFSFKNAIDSLVKNKYLMLVSLIIILVMTAVMGRMSVVAFYVIYCLGSYKLISLVMVIPSICAILVSFVVPSLTKKFGKRNVLMASNIVMRTGLLIIFLAPYDYIAMVLFGDVIFGMNMGFAISLTMVADSIDYMELKTYGMAYATYSLATKIGNAFGAAAGVMLLSAFGYTANEVQTPAALKGINIVTNLVPALIFFLSALVCFLWDMSDKEVDNIREKIRKKREQK